MVTFLMEISILNLSHVTLCLKSHSLRKHYKKIERKCGMITTISFLYNVLMDVTLTCQEILYLQ